ncbi:MAG: hypothetical protein Ct9H300mP28_06250 [Pseudomonadota bacterium]|nr:MAG: hypothetical protein Ct9H300mP28_06250 [Pseudomonadota bacterium]
MRVKTIKGHAVPDIDVCLFQRHFIITKASRLGMLGFLLGHEGKAACFPAEKRKNLQQGFLQEEENPIIHFPVLK